jgi:hypothetical protein
MVEYDVQYIAKARSDIEKISLCSDADELNRG